MLAETVMGAFVLPGHTMMGLMVKLKHLVAKPVALVNMEINQVKPQSNLAKPANPDTTVQGAVTI